MSSKVADPGSLAVQPFRWPVLPAPSDRNESPPPPPAEPPPAAPAASASLDEARGEAYQQGLQDGQARARAELRPMIEKISDAIAHAAGFKERLRREAELDVVRLAVGIARKILCREINVDQDAVHALVKVALDKLKQEDLLRVRCHPGLEGPVGRELSRAGLFTSVKLVADASLSPGAILLETTHGNLDASVDTQLREVERFLIGRTGGGQ